MKLPVLLLAACAVFGQANVSEDLVGKPAPKIELRTLDGKPFDLQTLKGRTVIIAFWATWCEPCRAEIPRLLDLQREYKNVAVMGISAEEPAVIRDFLTAEHLDFPTAVDPGKTVSNAYGVNLIPRTFVIDPAGVVKKMIRGLPGEATLRKALE